MEDLKLFLTLLIPLLIIMDPLGNLPFFLLFTKENNDSEQRKIAAIASITSCIILIFFALSGDLVLRFFGISFAAFELAGGFVFFIYALQMLHLIPSGIKTTSEEEREGIEKSNVALVPLATPLLAGPGAITAVLAQQQTAEHALARPLQFLSIITACMIVYLVFYFGHWLNRLLGVGGIRVVTRLMGLQLAVIAVQFMISGFQQIR